MTFFFFCNIGILGIVVRHVKTEKKGQRNQSFMMASSKANLQASGCHIVPESKTNKWFTAAKLHGVLDTLPWCGLLTDVLYHLTLLSSPCSCCFYALIWLLLCIRVNSIHIVQVVLSINSLTLQRYVLHMNNILS